MENPNTKNASIEGASQENPAIEINSPENNNSEAAIAVNNQRKWLWIAHSLLLCISFCYVASWGMIACALFIISSLANVSSANEAERHQELLLAVALIGIPMIIYFLCFLIYLRRPKIKKLEKFEKILLNIGMIIAAIAIIIMLGFLLLTSFLWLLLVVALGKNTLRGLAEMVGLVVGIFLPGVIFYASAALTFYNKPNINRDQSTAKKKLFTRIHLACLILIFMGFILAIIIPPQVRSKPTNKNVQTEKLEGDKEYSMR